MRNNGDLYCGISIFGFQSAGHQKIITIEDELKIVRRIKYDEVYPGDYANGWVANQRLGRYFQFYNTERKHPSLEKRTPCAVYFDRQPAAEEKSQQEEAETGRQATA